MNQILFYREKTLNKKLKKRKVLIITGSRGEYGYIRPVISLMKKSDVVDPEVLVTNMHMLPEFGNSVVQFRKDNIDVKHKIYMALSGYTNTTMVKSLGVFMLSMADILSNNNTIDLILLAGDRGEQLVAAMAGMHMNIPVAHIQAGELSGNVDGMARHAITRFSHIHFAANEDAKNRLIKMGEEPFRVFMVGAPQLDEFTPDNITRPEEISNIFSLNLEKPLIIVVQHPVTEQADQSGEQMRETMKAIIEMDIQTVVIYPNNDAGSVAIQKCISDNRTMNIRLERNVPRKDYAGLMNVASVIVGNSSSGILEAPSFKLPAVNIGRRQAGRLQAKNVINVKDFNWKYIKDAIREALSKEFRQTLADLQNPYGDGKSSKRIVKIIETIPIDEKLLYKNITY